MRTSRYVVLWIAIATAVALAGQQGPLERTLDEDALGEPIVWVPPGVTSGVFANRISMAGRVPVVFEAAPTDLPTGGPLRYDLRGLSVRQGLDLLVAADQRYTWSDRDGVVIIRPQESAMDAQNLLNQSLIGVSWRDITADDALARLVTRVAGDPDPAPVDAPLLDGTRFSVDMAEGTVLDLMAAIARAHGQLVWLTPDPVRPPGVGVSLSVSTFEGRGIGAVLPERGQQ